jgi:hypothetical protein
VRQTDSSGKDNENWYCCHVIDSERMQRPVQRAQPGSLPAYASSTLVWCRKASSACLVRRSVQGCSTSVMTTGRPLFSPARPPDGERLTEPASPPSTQTLGVLLVHGIGSQRPGDTLVHVGRSIHRWLCDFLKHLDIEVVAATLAGNPLLPNHPTPGSSLHLTSRFASRRCRNALNWQTEL